MPEESLKLVRLCHVIVILQHGEQKALAEPPRAQKQQMFPCVFDQGNSVGPVYVKITIRDNVIKITGTVRKFHMFLPCFQLGFSQRFGESVFVCLNEHHQC